MDKGNITTKDIKYFAPKHIKLVERSESIHPIGIDTEALTTGECFMYATSQGDVFKPEDWPGCMFNRKYRGKVFGA